MSEFQRGKALLPVGTKVTIYCPAIHRFMMMNDNLKLFVNGEGSLSTPADMQAQWSGRPREQFTVVDGGGDMIALHNEHHNRFLRMTTDGAVDGHGGPCDVDKLPPFEVWPAERFRVLDCGDGLIALHSPSANRFLRMTGEGSVDGHAGHRAYGDFPPYWRLEKLQVVRRCEFKRGKALLPIGTKVTIYCPAIHRFMMMNDAAHLEAQWSGRPREQFTVFTVVDGGGDMIALHNEHHNRFLRMTTDGAVDGHGGPCDVDKLPPFEVWGAERFHVLDCGDGLIALHSPCANRFLRMTGEGSVDGHAGTRAYGDFPSDWVLEKLQVVRQCEFVSSTSASRSRCVRISGATGGCSAKVNGVYSPTAEKSDSGTVTVYRKEGDGDVWLEYFGPTRCWHVKRIADTGRDSSYARCYAPDKCLPEQRPAGHWWVWTGTASEAQPAVAVVAASEAEAGTQTPAAVASPPNEYLCPITMDLMADPVMTSDGHTYERQAIETWFTQHSTSPKTGATLANLRLTRNHALHHLINDYRAAT